MVDEVVTNIVVNGSAPGVKEAATAVAAVNEALLETVKVIKSASTSLTQIEKNFAGQSTAARADAASVRALASSYRALGTAQSTVKAGSFSSTAATPVTGSLGTSVVPSNAPSVGNLSTTASRASTAATEAAQAASAKLTASIEAQAAAYDRVATASLAYNQAQAAQRAAVLSNSGAITAENSAFNNQAMSMERATAATAAAKAAIGTYRDSLANTRYALYGLTQGMALLGAGLVASNLIILGVGASFQTTFANISRTTGATGTQLTALEKQFVTLGQTIPTSFADLGNIATLAGQLNIPTKSVANFTKAVAEFSATTNVDVNTAATAFGRLDALLPDVKGNYEALGSAILNVGVNSVATESQIISVSSQVASAGVQAGLTAAQVVGLSASYASLGIAAESARGTTLRVFGLINKAVATGGASLDEFAATAGISADKFAASWGTKDFINTFQDLLKGINENGSKAQLTLSDLGITAARDQNNLLKLSQNTGLVADNLGYASDGFTKATKLSTSFAKITATLGAQLTELGNSFQALFGTLGASGLTAVTVLVDAIKGAVVGLTELSQNPFVQGAAAFVGAFTLASGVILLLGSVIGKTIATMLAGRPVIALFSQTVTYLKAAYLEAGLAADIAGTSTSKFALTVDVAGAAIKRFLATSGIFIAIAAAVGLASLAVSDFNADIDAQKKANESAATTAKNYFTNLGSLGDALAKDTEAHAKGAEATGTITVATKTATKATSDWVGGLETATGSQIKLGAGTSTTTTAVDKQTFSIGANAKAWFASAVANNAALQKMYQDQSKYKGLDVTGFLTALATNDTKKAATIYAAYAAYQKAHDPTNPNLLGTNNLTSNQNASKAQKQQVADVANTLKAFTGSIEAAAKGESYLGLITSATGVKFDSTGAIIKDTSGAAADAGADFTKLGDNITAAFANTNSLSKFAADFNTLIQGINTGGNSFNAFSQTGAANLANLQTSIASTIDAGHTLGLTATQSVAVLFNELQSKGVSTAALLQQVASIPGVNASDLSAYVDGTGQMTVAGKALGKAMTEIDTSGKKAAKSTASVGSAAKKAAPAVVTLADYASDLSTVFQRASDIRFAPSEGLDKITSGWQAVSDASATANKNILDAQATLAGLTSDKTIQEYFLSVANAYGDTLRAGAINANIATDNSGIVSATSDLTTAQDSASKSLVGNTEAAIANRATVEGLVTDYQDYITSLAASGASQDKITAAIKSSKADFTAQATALGFSTSQIKTYSAAFDDMTTAVSKVPRNINVTANVNPALQAINEFNAKAKASMASGGTAAGTAASNAITAAYTAGLQRLAAIQAIAAQISNIQAQESAYLKSTSRPSDNRISSYDNQIKALNSKLAKYQSGGYTGNLATNAVAGVVHGQEYVLNAQATKSLGVPLLNALNSGKGSSASVAASAGGSAIQTVQLTASNLQAITDAVSVKLQIGNNVIASATNASNLTQANRAAN